LANEVQTSSKRPERKGTVSSINLGLRYSNLVESRGVITYRDYQIDPVIAISFLDDRVEFLGYSIGYKDYILDDRLRLRTRFVSQTDSPLFPVDENIKKDFPHRPDTYEWSNSAEFFWPGYNDQFKAEFDFIASKDISIHHGHALYFQTKVRLFEFESLGYLIEPNFYALIGWGDSKSNAYYYGPSANSDGFSHFSTGVWLAFPEEADRFYPIIQFRYFELFDRYKEAEYTRGRNRGWLFSIIATASFLE